MNPKKLPKIHQPHSEDFFRIQTSLTSTSTLDFIELALVNIVGGYNRASIPAARQAKIYLAWPPLAALLCLHRVPVQKRSQKRQIVLNSTLFQHMRQALTPTPLLPFHIVKGGDIYFVYLNICSCWNNIYFKSKKSQSQFLNEK